MTPQRIVVLSSILAVAIMGSCRRRADAPPAESTTLNVTHWTARTELYMEYPPLVAGQTALFAVTSPRSTISRR